MTWTLLAFAVLGFVGGAAFGLAAALAGVRRCGCGGMWRCASCGATGLFGGRAAQ